MSNIRVSQLKGVEYPKYIKYMETKEFSETTKNNYKFSIENFFKFLKNENIPILNNKNINGVLYSYQKELKKSGKYSNETINQYLTRLKPFLLKCGLAYDIEPIKTEKNKQIKYLTSDEIKEILKTNKQIKNEKTGHKLEAIICLMFNTGARVGEITKLKIGDIKTNENNKNEIILHGKGNKTAKLGLNNDTLNKINIMLEDRENPQPNEPLFIGRAGKPLKERTIQKHFKELAKATDERLIKETGVNPELTKRFTPHSLRHSIAIYLLNVKKEPINTVQECLRHENINTTQHYLKISNEEIITLQNEIIL